MIRNKDFALLYAGRAVFDKNGEYAGVVVGWNDMHGVILGIDHADGWQPWGSNDIGVSEEEFASYEYRNAGTLVEPLGEPIKEHGGMKPVSMGDGSENVSSKI